MGPPKTDEVVQLLDQLQILADQLVMEDRIIHSGLVLMARQTIRALHTKLRPPAPQVLPPPEAAPVGPDAGAEVPS